MSQSNINQYNTTELVNQKYPLFNEYASIYLKPDIRKEWVIRSKMPSIMALAIDLRERLASQVSLDKPTFILSCSHSFQTCNNAF